MRDGQSMLTINERVLCGWFLSLCLYPVGKHVYYLHEGKNVVIINHFLEFKISSRLLGLISIKHAHPHHPIISMFGKKISVEGDRQQSINQHLLGPIPRLYLWKSVCDVMSTGEQCLTIAVKTDRLSNVLNRYNFI